MITIEVPEKQFLRGGSIQGTVYMSESPAKKIDIMLLRTEINPLDKHPPAPFVEALSTTADSGSVSKSIPFAYTIPEDAPYSFDNGLFTISWRITALVNVRFPQIALRTLAVVPSSKIKTSNRMALREVVVLPHVLQSEAPGYIQPPTCKKFLTGIKAKPLHSWRCSPFQKSRTLSMTLNQDHYLPGERISGTVYFSDECANVDVACYLVFLSKHKHTGTAEEEHLISHRCDTFFKGSSFSFSGRIPLTAYPTLQTKYSKIWWMARVVITSTLKFTKVLEQEIRVDPSVV